MAPPLPLIRMSQHWWFRRFIEGAACLVRSPKRRVIMNSNFNKRFLKYFSLSLSICLLASCINIKQFEMFTQFNCTWAIWSRCCFSIFRSLLLHPRFSATVQHCMQQNHSEFKWNGTWNEIKSFSFSLFCRSILAVKRLILWLRHDVSDIWCGWYLHCTGKCAYYEDMLFQIFET